MQTFFNSFFIKDTFYTDHPSKMTHFDAIIIQYNNARNLPYYRDHPSTVHYVQMGQHFISQLKGYASTYNFQTFGQATYGLHNRLTPYCIHQQPSPGYCK